MGITPILATQSGFSNVYEVSANGKKQNSGTVLNFNTSIIQPENTSPYESLGCKFSKKSIKNEDKSNKEYDQNGNLVKENFGSYTVEYEYNENGVKTKEIRRELPNSTYEETIIILFDENGRESKRITQTGEGKTLQTYQQDMYAVYDEKTGRLLKRVTKNENGEDYFVEYFDKNGRIATAEYLNENNKTVYEYDKKGFLVGTINVTDDFTVTQANTYNKNNKLTRTYSVYKYTNGVTESSETNYRYGENGQLKKVVDYYKNINLGSIYLYYDDNGNLIQKKFVDENNAPQRIVKYENGQVVEDTEL